MVKIIFLSFLFTLQFFICIASDEVVFFNVGEGHCTLAYKQGCDPLLIDAGSRRKALVEEDLQEFERPLGTKGQLTVQQLTDKIVGFWGVRQAYNFNIILTHRDADHTAYIWRVLDRLRQLQHLFTCNILMGGREQDYSTSFCSRIQPHLNPGLPRLIYSFNHQGLHQGELELGFLKSSGCITHLFCPTGRTDPNTWSIITRLEFNQEPRQFSVLIAGDAGIAAQNAHFIALGLEPYKKLRSNIFLFPHHGGQPLSQAWIQAIDPEVVIVSAGKFNDDRAAHPKAIAIESLFWQDNIPVNTALINPVEQLTTQLGAIQLNNYNRRERIWKPVDPHKVIYYGSKNDSERIQRKLARSQYSHFDFVDDTWYTGFGLANESSWRCALATFPLYNLYSTGTIIIQGDPLHIEPYKINFVEVPSQTDFWVRWMNDSIMDDRGDMMAFHLLSHQTKRAVYQYIVETARNVREAETIFFLSFIVIPHTECEKKEHIFRYQEKKLFTHLNYFLPRVRGIDFNNRDDVNFFKEVVVDTLFAKGRYECLDMIIPFTERCFLFDAFFTGQHVHVSNQRENLFYLYYMIYNRFGNHRDEISTENLQALAESFRQLNYRKNIEQSDGINNKRIFPTGSLEDILFKAFYIYDKCNTEEDQYYELDIDDLGPFVHLLYANFTNQQVSNADIELISEVLSVLPVCFNVPLHTTTEHLINLLPRIRVLEEGFEYITNSFTNRLLLTPQMSHLEILGGLF